MIDIKSQFDHFQEEVLSTGYDRVASFRTVFYAGAYCVLGELGYSELLVEVEEAMKASVEEPDKPAGSDILLKDIVSFHDKFGFSFPQEPKQLSKAESDFRIAFMTEELTEYINADTQEDRFDALIDLAYVVLGTAHYHGFPFAEGWRRVHEANMSKERAERAEQSKRGYASDIIKPEGWVAPDLKDLV